MRARILAGQELELAQSWARERALEQALLLADLTQLAADSLPAGVLEGPRVRGLACCYTGLPFLAVGLWSEGPAVAKALLAELAAHQPRLLREPVYALVDEAVCRQLAQAATVEQVQEELKRVLGPGGLAPARQPSPWQAVRLGPGDLPALAALYATAPVTAWSPGALEHGPFWGIRVQGELVSAAGTHLLTPWVTEIGHITTHPAQRRRGLAEATIRGLVAGLQGQTECIYLMHFSDNEEAGRLYERLGFGIYGRLYLTRFRLR